MLEIVPLLILSIAFTFISYTLSKILIKKLRINHPQNKSVIFFLVILTALLILVIPASTLQNTTKDTHMVNNPDETKGEINLLMYSEPSCYKTTSLVDTEEWEQIPLISSEQINIPKYYNIYLSSCQTQMFLYETLIISNPSGLVHDEAVSFDYTSTTATLSNYDNDHTSTDLSLISLFWKINFLLIFAGAIYLMLSLTIGKTYLLRSLQATKCSDHYIIKLINNISKEFGISMPRVYTYDGSPNAFVLGYPATLIFSNQLLLILTRDELKQTFRHELAHIKNKDTILKPFLQSLRILFFYNPFVHLAYYKIIKNRELLADNYRIWSKSQRIDYMGALIKIREHTQISKLSSVGTALCNSFTLPVFSFRPKKLSISERFDCLFNDMIKKSTCTILICMILIVVNISLFSIAQNIVDQPDEILADQEVPNEIYFILDSYSTNCEPLCGHFEKHYSIYYVSNATSCPYQTQGIQVIYLNFFQNIDVESYNNSNLYHSINPFDMNHVTF
jgi:beta-lactamase regulating signal transducer with metallopeptidase domain